MNKNLATRETVRLLFTSNCSYRGISKRTGMAPNTIRRYKRMIGNKGYTLEELESLNDDELQNVFSQARGKRKERRMPAWAEVYKELHKKGMTLMLLWNEYVLDDPSTAYSYSQFTHHFREYLGKVDIAMRQTHFAGEECFIDFTGRLIPYYDQDSQQKREAQVFVAVMGCSDKIFVRACSSQQLPCWIDCHIHMMNFWGGVPEVLVPDNLKSAVIKAGKIPVINRTYLDFANHYTCQVFPARARKPQDKSKAELAVKFVTRWIIAWLRHRQFFSIEEINAAIEPLLHELNERSFKRLPGCRNTRFEELDKPMLKPLPDRPFEYGEWTGKLKVGPDYHVYVHNHAYSVPYKMVSEYVEVRVTLHTIEIYHLGKRIAIHKRSEVQGGATTNAAHRPAQHAAYANQSLDDYVLWAVTVGSSATEIIKAQFEGKPNHSTAGARACDQLRHLCRLYGEERFESACEHALRLHSQTVKTLRSILQSGADQLTRDIPIQASLPMHANVRGAAYFSGGAA